VCSAALFHVPAVQFVLTVMNILKMDAMPLTSNVTILASVIPAG